jgi:nucleoside-triphosphatase THEP1
VLQATLNDILTNAAMLEGLELVFNLIARYEVVERLYLRRPSRLQKGLQEAIVRLYAAVLEFLLQANRYYRQKTVRRIAKSIIKLEDATVQHVEKIKVGQADVDAYVQLISGEILSNMDSTVGAVLDELGRLDGSARETHDRLDLEVMTLRMALKDLDEPFSRMASQMSAINDNLTQQQRLMVFDWLSTVPYMSHHRSKVKTLLAGSGQWLVRKPEFVEWMESSSSSILWLHGIPGSGKSMLVAHVIEYLHNRNSTQKCAAPLAYFYCARTANEPERADPDELLRSILEQLSSSGEDLPIREPVAKAFIAKKKEARGTKLEKLGLEETEEIILELLEDNPATIVIDGLDECDPARRQDLLNALRKIIKDSNSIFKVFVSSRDDHDLVHRLSQTPNLYIHATDNEKDIRRFVKWRLDEAIDKERLLCGKVSRNLRDIIVEELIKKARGMFRLISLHIESLCDPHQIKTEANVLEALKGLPQDLKKSYATILSQVSSSQEPNPKLAVRTLKWLLCAQQALDSEGFIVAICADMSDQIIPSRSDILSICCNLVVYDEETDIFRLAHLSVQEYLEGLDCFSGPENNALPAEQCLHWIMATDQERHYKLRTNSPEFRDQNDMVERKSYSFDHHADIYWAQYAQLAGRTRSQGRLWTLLRRFLTSPESKHPEGNEALAAWVSRLGAKRDPNHPLDEIFKYCVTSPPNPMFIACAFNLAETASDLIKKELSSAALHTSSELAWESLRIATLCDHADTLRLVFKEAHKLLDDVGYWGELLFAAADRCNLRALRTILEEAGDHLVMEYDIEYYVKWASGYRSQHGPVLKLLFESNKQIRVTEAILAAVFENVWEGANIAQQLVKFTDEVVITMPLFKAVTANKITGHQIMAAIMCSANTPYIDAQVVQAILNQGNRFWYSVLLSHRMKKLALGRDNLTSETLLQDRPPGMAPRLTEQEEARMMSECVELAWTDIGRILTRQQQEKIELTWQDLVVEGDFDRGKYFILLLLRMKPKMKQSAINMLICRYDIDVVKELLNFRSIKITNEILKAAAGNLKYGKKVIKLLLKKEAGSPQVGMRDEEPLEKLPLDWDHPFLVDTSKG